MKQEWTAGAEADRLNSGQESTTDGSTARRRSGRRRASKRGANTGDLEARWRLAAWHGTARRAATVGTAARPCPTVGTPSVSKPPTAVSNGRDRRSHALHGRPPSPIPI